MKKWNGYNCRGFRGNLFYSDSTLKIACFGGSTTYGYPVHFEETWPFELQNILRNKNYPVDIINFGVNSQGIYGINYDVKEYMNYEWDIAIIYNGYNDFDPTVNNQYSFGESDFIFNLTGYKFIIPHYINDKLSAYLNSQKSTKVLFEKSVSNSDLRSKIINKYKLYDSLAINWKKSHQEAPYQAYMSTLQATFDELLKQEKKVFMVAPPGLGNTVLHKGIQKMIQEKYQSIKYINASNFINLKDKELCLDGMHLSAKGNKTIANKLAPYLLYSVIQKVAAKRKTKK